MRIVLKIGLCLAAAAATSIPTSGRAAEPRHTIVNFELLAPLRGTGLNAQRWGRIFHGMGVSYRVREPILDDTSKVTEQVRGTIRTVDVVGRLEPDGTLKFPEREFSPTDVQALREWIEELKLYGAQGAPDKQPLWGLNKTQFDLLFNKLSVPVEADWSGKPVTEVLAEASDRSGVTIRLLSASDAPLAKAPVARQDLSTLTLGTALAVTLRDSGLGFQPRRTPGGAVELIVQPAEEMSQPWPVGWDLPEGSTRAEVFPKLFEMVQTGFQEQSLKDVLDAIEAATGVLLTFDYHALDERNIELDTLQVSFPNKKTAWALILNQIVGVHRLSKEYRVDEAQTPFLDIYPFSPRRRS